MPRLSARAVSRIETPDGVIAEVVVVEPNGDEFTVSCVCRDKGTTVDGEGDILTYLNLRYGDVAFCRAVRNAVLGDSTHAGE